MNLDLTHDRFRNLAKQLVSFGLIGLIATFVHALVFHFSYVYLEFSSLRANTVGFLIAFSVSYMGQFRITFRRESKQVSNKYGAFLKFFCVAMIGFGLNTVFAFVVIDVMVMPHYVYLFLLCCVTPLVIFLLTKLWVFSKSPQLPI